MDFKTFGNIGAPSLLLISGLGVSYEIFKGMNHGQLLVDHPEEVAVRITRMHYEQDIIDTSID